MNLLQGMATSIAAAAFIGAAGAQQVTNPRVELTREDIEGRYALAKAALEDESITQVGSVPTMLAVCTQHGHAPAARLLLDVYEGRFKGLAAQPEKAAAEARTIAEVPVPFPDDPDCAAMHIEAMYRWALYQEHGYGCEKNEAEAYAWMCKAADAGLPAAQTEKARMLARGKGTAKNLQEAARILLEVARTAPDTPHVFFYLGYVCYSTNTAAGRRRAAELFYRGALHNDADCMNNLGAMCEKGIEMPPNAAKALSLYRKAAALGNKQASANMQRLAYKEGIEANRHEETSSLTRIGNAAQRVIRTLPINDKSQDRLWQWLSGHPVP